MKKGKVQHFRSVDFFAGVGGIRLGLEKAGFETVFSNDFDPFCKVTFDLNSDLKQTTKDIRLIKGSELPSFELFAGGFPCQAFSVAGYREGFNDKQGRGNLFFEILRIIDEANKKPSVVFLENVKNLLGHDGGRTFSIIKKELQSFGYYVTERVLNSMSFGNVPQTRERIYIIGFNDIAAFNRFDWPAPVKLSKNFIDILENDPDKRFYYKGKPLHKQLEPYITKDDTIYQWRRKYVRENKKGVCPTLTANMGTGGHNVPIILEKRGIRKLTPRECFSLQGFPRSFRLPDSLADCHLYKQAGNSVSVPVIEAIGRNIFSALNGKNLKKGQLALNLA
jgi:DNA (cytosine-5)-methyltransferase 1